MSVGLVAIAAGLSNLWLRFGFYLRLHSIFYFIIAGLEFSFRIGVFHFDMSPAVELEYLICFYFVLPFSDWLVFQKQQKHQSVLYSCSFCIHVVIDYFHI